MKAGATAYRAYEWITGSKEAGASGNEVKKPHCPLYFSRGGWVYCQLQNFQFHLYPLGGLALSPQQFDGSAGGAHVRRPDWHGCCRGSVSSGFAGDASKEHEPDMKVGRFEAFG